MLNDRQTLAINKAKNRCYKISNATDHFWLFQLIKNYAKITGSIAHDPNYTKMSLIIS